ncbi:hypothetical protein POTOM_024833 [Populus tomentosa]|uniref:Uncharacterized protein n=1 Tax=Populus tomentosa TaxID=118781 RepID=A0A8X7ZH19_POPTO|nr:hypothetical protein POTOM_024833 [Populus tomentosa]
MAPSNNTRRSTRYKRQEVLTKRDETSRDLHCSHSTTATSSEESCNEGIVGCSTPKAQRFKIPETLSCPPAPMKRRATTKSSMIKEVSKELTKVLFDTVSGSGTKPEHPKHGKLCLDSIESNEEPRACYRIISLTGQDRTGHVKGISTFSREFVLLAE